MTYLKLGLAFPGMRSLRSQEAPWESTASIAEIASIARRAEELGFDFLTFPDHIVIPKVATAAYGPRWLDPLTSMAFIAAHTSRIRLMTWVLIAPYRHPLAVAKAVATVDLLSAGRVTLGVGTGHMADEFAALGVPIGERGARTNEFIRAMIVAWTQDELSFEGKFASFSGAYMEPKPVQLPYPPIWVGGNSPGAMRRAARLGDGWTPTAMSRAELEAGIAFVREQRLAAGRTETFDFLLPTSVDRPAEASLTANPANAAELVDELSQLAEMGGTAVRVPLGATHSAADYLERMVWFAAEVMPVLAPTLTAGTGAE